MARGARAVVRDVDRGWSRVRDLGRALAERESFVKVGVLDDGGKGSARPDGGALTQAEIALVLELGSGDGKIPARPFVRRTFDEKRAQTSALAQRLVGLIFDGKLDVTRALGIMGAWFAAEIKKTVTAGEEIPPPNAPRTLKRKLARTRPGSKGQPRTLIDTGRLISSITWALIMRRG